ncbi:isopentenyl-diphosphate Delta-isomerase [Maribellus sp. YY47]|uniref:isopentenyl-diphosphate Delta-isomerase n=1 Tax=Maribellus sp. YY47 TaxID=2929486 RepID=UPI002001473C|nr:isopentenyl-diphosphate Delta-isomerase [Maribellus sp. YY47]MCK3684139.1 isopentenyl-diphosphate Delta-isomerase [Maribellus sp. YY47]
MKQEQVILVDENDAVLGAMEKMEAHRNPVLHRAISVFIVNKKGEWLLQRRALGKYHSNGLWTNTCCSHPQPGESSLEAANRRLVEEMGMKAELDEKFHFIYREPLDNELTEYELDHVFVGVSDQLPNINTSEVHSYKYIAYDDLKKDIETNPGNYTVWFLKIVDKVNEYLKK